MSDSFHDDSRVFAQHVLALNDRGNHTIPARGLYPHQWLWDSCFIAIGLRHLNTHRAQKELISLTKGQWRNGMLPHMLLHPDGWRSFRIWQSHRAYYSHKHINTSGITQPPMLAEAVWQVADKLNKTERQKFIERMLPALIKYHQWLYRERDPHGEGLTLLIHPWESGMDNTPSWMSEIHANRKPLWVSIVELTGLGTIIAILRRDRRWVLENQRADTIDMLLLYSLQRSLRRKRYDIHTILRHAPFAIEDLAFNAILVRANDLVKKMSKEVGYKIPAELIASMHKTPLALELLWNEKDGQYYSRNFVTHELITQPTIATLLPLYARSVTKKRAAELVKLMKNREQYDATFPLPTVPAGDRSFKPQVYWQGPAWVNMNWLVIQGLQHYGYAEEAQTLTDRTLQMVDMAGMREYFDPETGKGLGAENFSWTAALVIDLLEKEKTA